LILSAGMLLGWYGQRNGKQPFIDAAAVIDRTIADAIAAGECTRDVGGSLGTREAGAAFVARLQAA